MGDKLDSDRNTSSLKLSHQSSIKRQEAIQSILPVPPSTTSSSINGYDSGTGRRIPRPISYQPRPITSQYYDTEDDYIKHANGDIIINPRYHYNKSNTELPFETDYIKKPRLASSSWSEAQGKGKAIVFFRQAAEDGESSYRDLEQGRGEPIQFPKMKGVHKKSYSDSETVEQIRHVAMGAWAPDRSANAIWYADPLANMRDQSSTGNPNGALRSRICKAISCSLVIAASVSVVLLCAIGATLIITKMT